MLLLCPTYTLSLDTNIVLGVVSTAITHSFINCLLANTYKLSAATNSNLYKRPTFLDTSLVPINIIPSAAAIECTSSKGIFVCP